MATFTDLTDNLTNHFLIAMPGLADPNFYHTVTYLCDHNQDGAMGLVINRPMDLMLGELFDYLNIPNPKIELLDVPIYQGGPVQTDRGFVLHKPMGQWEATMPITPQLELTMSQDIIEAIAYGEGPDQYLIALGYAGWGSGQLEAELASNAWLNGPAESTIIFDKPIDQRWIASAALLGVQISQISPDVGHA
ncbi:MAG: YqgE/AlgH family protein [Gammaproteobacteria bacterium]|nr:YqgE/AlgH family protein [Gammaproteobacteria bacterium]MDH5650374.1 YqgE/AlgH family protein [Gammaproteobacteria bacterium]